MLTANQQTANSFGQGHPVGLQLPFFPLCPSGSKKGVEIEWELDYNISQRDAEPRKRTPLKLTADRVGLLNDKRLNAHICPSGCAFKSEGRLKYWSFAIMNAELV